MARIIDEKRYKKVTRKQVQKDKEILRKKNIEDRKFERDFFKNDTFDFNKINKPVISSEKSISKNTKKYNKKKKNKSFSWLKKIVVVIVIAFSIFGINRLSKMFVKDEEVVVQTGINNEKTVTLVQNYNFKIGMFKLDTIDYFKSKNIILNELVNMASNSFIKINRDYSFEYMLAQDIEKVTNTEYLITLNEKYKVSVDDIKDAIAKIIQAGSTNLYYNALSNIKSVESIDSQKIKIVLNNANSYFPFYLDFPIFLEDYSNYTISLKDINNLFFNINKSEFSQIGSITFTGYSDSDNLINSFKNGNIDMFTATSDSLINLLGKYEYNLKKYRNGETIFLFGNKDSKLFSIKEVRQALVSSLNRDDIIKKINPKFSEVIDIPYIYSSIKYKYDIYGVTNILSANGWEKSGGVYQKNINNENTLLELKLLVNENDSDKVKIADTIKEMAEICGIKINIEKKKDNELMDCINNKQYDIILATVNINKIPDISFIEQYLNINDVTNNAIETFKNSDFNNISKNLINLQDTLSDEIACIGLLAKTSDIVYQKNINGFEDISYMKIFDNLKTIGKIQDVKYQE